MSNLNKFDIYNLKNYILENKFCLFYSGILENVLIIDIIKCNLSICKEFNICNTAFIDEKNYNNDDINYNSKIISNNLYNTIIYNNKCYTFKKDCMNEIYEQVKNENKYNRSVYFGILKNNNPIIYNCIEMCIRQVIFNIVKYLIEKYNELKLVFIRNDSICFSFKDCDNINKKENLLKNINNIYTHIKFKMEKDIKILYQSSNCNETIGICFDKTVYKSGTKYKDLNDEQIKNLINEYYNNLGKNLKKIQIDNKIDNIIYFKKNFIDKEYILINQNELIIKLWDNKIKNYPVLYEYFLSSEKVQNPIYIFFDIDIDVDVNFNLNEWNENRINYEVELFNVEFNKLILNNKFNNIFAISYSIRKNKISIHLVSINVKFYSFTHIKELLKNNRFKSFIGNYIDICVYRKNGSLRVVNSFKNGDKLSFLKPLNYKTEEELYLHLITKFSSNIKYIVLQDKSNNKDFNKNNNEYIINENNIIKNNELNNKNVKYYSKYLSNVDDFITVYFNYENCISDYNKFYIFVYLIACITNGNINYKKKLLDIYDKYEYLIKNKIKRNIINYNFKYYLDFIKEHDISNLADYLLNKLQGITKTIYEIQEEDNNIINENFKCKTVYFNNQYLSFDVIPELINVFNIKVNYNIFIKSDMGTGKTKLIFDLLNKLHPLSNCLIICTRLSMIREYEKRLKQNKLSYIINNCENDLENQLIELFNYPQIWVTTCESLYKIKSKINNFTFIILDEMESISAQFISSETHDKNIDLNNLILEEYIKSTNLVVMDGLLTDFLKDKIIDIKKKFEKRKSLNYIYSNTFKKQKQINKLSSLEDLFSILFNNKNKTIFIAVDSKIISITLYEIITGLKYDLNNINNINDNVIIYNSDTSKKIEIEKTNLYKKYFIYTPSLDVSVSIDNIEVDIVIGYFINKSISYFTKSQMLMRARKSIIIYILLKDSYKIKKDDLKDDLILEEYFNIYDDFNHENMDKNNEYLINNYNKIIEKNKSYINNYFNNISFVDNIIINNIYEKQYNNKNELMKLFLNNEFNKKFITIYNLLGYKFKLYNNEDRIYDKFLNEYQNFKKDVINIIDNNKDNNNDEYDDENQDKNQYENETNYESDDSNWYDNDNDDITSDYEDLKDFNNLNGEYYEDKYDYEDEYEDFNKNMMRELYKNYSSDDSISFKSDHSNQSDNEDDNINNKIIKELNIKKIYNNNINEICLDTNINNLYNYYYNLFINNNKNYKFILKLIDKNRSMIKELVSFFKSQYENNKKYYYIEIFIEELFNEIQKNYELRKDLFKDVNVIIKNTMNKYYSLKFSIKVKSNILIKNLISFIYYLYDKDNYSFKSIKEFYDFIIDNMVIIKILLNIIKSKINVRIKLIIISILYCYDSSNNTISLVEIINFCNKKLHNKFDDLTLRKLKNIINKYISNKLNINII